MPEFVKETRIFCNFFGNKKHSNLALAIFLFFYTKKIPLSDQDEVICCFKQAQAMNIIPLIEICNAWITPIYLDEDTAVQIYEIGEQYHCHHWMQIALSFAALYKLKHRKLKNNFTDFIKKHRAEVEEIALIKKRYIEYLEFIVNFFPNVKRLHLHGDFIKRNELNFINCLNRLEHLTVSYDDTISIWKKFKRLRNLKTFTIHLAAGRNPAALYKYLSKEKKSKEPTNLINFVLNIGDKQTLQNEFS